MNTKDRLISALTQLDAKELERTKGSRAKGYNPYALAIYFSRVDDICADIDAGADARAAIVAGFTGKPQSVCLKALGLDGATEDEKTGKGGGWHYVPASPSLRE